MELVELVWPKLIKVWISESQRLRDRLGAHQDLHVLARLTGPHQPLAYWRSRLAAPIAHRQAADVAAAQRLAGRLFAEKPEGVPRPHRGAVEEPRGGAALRGLVAPQPISPYDPSRLIAPEVRRFTLESSKIKITA